MAKTVIELLNEVRASEELQKEATAVFQKKDNQGMVDFLRKHDCDASLKEVKKAFLEELERLKEGAELSPEELEAAAGGGTMDYWNIGMCFDSAESEQPINNGNNGDDSGC